jgi:hypothetical protein
MFSKNSVMNAGSTAAVLTWCRHHEDQSEVAIPGIPEIASLRSQSRRKPAECIFAAFLAM